MSEIKQYAVLEYVVDVLQKAITGSKVKKISPDESAILDGNASINIHHRYESNGNIAAILISDDKEILYSEELLEKVYKLHEGADHHPELKAALSIANIIINGLNIEAELIFRATIDQLYGLSGSYEFANFIEKDIQRSIFKMKFGEHIFEVIIMNEPQSVFIEPNFTTPLAPAVKQTISADLSKVAAEINKQFKKDQLLDKIIDFKLKGQ